MSRGREKFCRIVCALLILLIMTGCCSRKSKLKDGVQYGYASWYGGKFHGRKTANGERYDMFAMTAAHRTLPFDTYVRVTNLENGRSVVVRINDRGPFKDEKKRIIDLSLAAARELDMLEAGVVEVKLEVLNRRR
ncbi:MAG: septal ring lytic transglycosylase RlpA family protein [Candidatus Coatesbacteria bacterium]|nr:septal ring lytic transglycosylase RlpA family protein [Candidatus Coatesbacteria bacterium]